MAVAVVGADVVHAATSTHAATPTGVSPTMAATFLSGVALGLTLGVVAGVASPAEFFADVNKARTVTRRRR